MRPNFSLTAVLAAALLVTPAAADEVEDALEAALEAYRAGDIALAREEVDFAATLIGQMKAEGLGGFLPEAMAGWTREEGDTSAQALGAFGGGIVANATYRGPGGDFELTLMAENQMVAAMGAMLSNTALMGSMGTVKRAGRQRYVVTREGDIQALINNRVMIQITGSAPVEAKEAHFLLIDLAGLADF